MDYDFMSCLYLLCIFGAISYCSCSAICSQPKNIVLDWFIAITKNDRKNLENDIERQQKQLGA